MGVCLVFEEAIGLAFEVFVVVALLLWVHVQGQGVCCLALVLVEASLVVEVGVFEVGSEVSLDFSLEEVVAFSEEVEAFSGLG